MSSARPTPTPPVNDLAERAVRVRAMLARWESENIATEPDWAVEDVAPMRLESTPIARERE